MPDYRGIQECYWKWALETSGGSAGTRMLAPSAAVIPPAPTTFNAFGYSSMPSFSINNQPVPIYSLGSYRLFNSYKGIRDYTLRADITLGNWQFLQYALRSSGLGTINGYKGLPTLAIALGSMNTYGTGFHWIARYCFIRDVTFQFQPGMPVRVTVDFAPLFIELAADAKTLTEEEVATIGGEILGWDNLDWSARGEDYSHWLTGSSIRIVNGIDPIGQRRNKGDHNPLSRVRRALVPTNEEVNCDYQFAAELEEVLLNAGNDSTLWGQVVFNAYNTDSGGTKSMVISIDHNRLGNVAMQGGQIGQTLAFSASCLSGFLSISGS